jgi:methionyl aminopeptidase
MNLRVLNPEKTLLEDQRVAAGIVSDVLLELERLTKPDVSLDMLDELAERMIRERGAIPANKGYQPSWSKTPYPATICASIDSEVCHAPPAGRILKDGQIVKYDLGCKYRSGCGDAALTVAIGNISNRKQRAMRYARQALNEGVKKVRAGVSLLEIGTAIQDYATMNGYRIIKEFGGHAIGREMHMEPHIPHYYRSENETVLLKAGQVICLEPMLTPGDGKIGLATDQWTAFTLDNQPVAMFEEMILVTENGYEILTHHLIPPV